MREIVERTEISTLKRIQIGRVLLANNVLAAPMAGVTDKTFRIIAKKFGCGLVCTEMVSDKAIIYNNQRTWKLFDLTGEKKPVAVQIFGSEPAVMARAAAVVVESGADLVDINMGCPTPKIVKNGEGSALMRNVSLAGRIVEAVVKSVPVPVTVKMRLGWDEEHINVLEVARAVEESGAAAVTVHGRTRAQFYAGRANWAMIGQVADALSIPVIGNGDIWQATDAREMIAQTGCSGVMIGRGAMGNPWLFRQTVTLLQEGRVLPDPTPEQKIRMALTHLDMVVADKGEYIGVREMRKHLAWYIKGLRGAARMRERINALEKVDQVKSALAEYLEQLGTVENS